MKKEDEKKRKDENKSERENKRQGGRRRIISDKKRKTYVLMFRSIIGAVVAIIIGLIVLQFFGINVTSMLAGVGIASIIIGFALQDALKDIIRGLEIVSDGYFEVGDVIKFGENMGGVQSIGLRTVKMQDMNSMNIVSIANRDFDKVEVVSGYVYLEVPLPHEIKPAAADLVLREITKGILGIDKVTTAEYQGLDAINDSYLSYQIAITCEPADILSVKRAALGVVTEIFAAHKLRLPYPAVVVKGK